MKDYTLLFEGVLTILFALVTMYVIPWIKAKVSAEELADIIKWVKIAVQAAEMIYKESGMGEIKKAYVKKFLSDKNIHFDEMDIDTLIEGAVLELKEQFVKK